jgi:hypothetical protein
MQTGESTATASQKRSQKKEEIPLAKRLALTPKEFAQLFGKHAAWAYRQIYSRNVKVIMDRGKMMIPRAEAQQIVKSADFYNSPKTTSAHLPSLSQVA